MKEVKEMEMDPVCNMRVDPAKARWTSELEGRTYYFCAPGCKATFDKNPRRWTGGMDSHGSHGHSCCGDH